MKRGLALLAVAITVISYFMTTPLTQAQSTTNLWRDVSERSIPNKGGERSIIPQKYRLLAVDLTALDNLLKQTPLENSRAARETEIQLTLPLPNGSWGVFRVENSPIMEAPLAAKYPDITTYQAWGLVDKTASARLDRTPSGFHAMILSAYGTVYIDPYQDNDTTHYISYYKQDFAKATSLFKEKGVKALPPMTAPRQQAWTVGETLHTYRLAVATSGEYTQHFGGTVKQALEAVVKTVNRVIAIYRVDLSTTFILVADEEKIIFTDPATDPYADNNTPNKDPLGENQKAIDAAIGTANYDVGHLFDTGGGGVAGGGPCVDTSKAHGQTGSDDPQGDPFDVDYVAHEMGHQFGAGHTFNSKNTEAGACEPGNYMQGSAYEPASGSTILSYTGICKTQNLQPNSSAYFHNISIQEMTNYINSTDGRSCGTHTPTGNTPPVVNAGANMTIGLNTSFTLKGSATDADNDGLTYAWEQFDQGTGWTQAAVLPNTDTGEGPIFRSYDPVTKDSRTFPNPDFPELAAKGESLPTTARTLNFRLTVRDGKGGVAYSSMKVNVVADPNAANLTVSKQVTTANRPAKPGDKVVYTIIVTNTGTSEATGVKLADTLPQYVTGTNLDKTVNIPGNSSIQETIEATLDANTPGGVNVVNTVFVTHASGNREDSASFIVDAVNNTPEPNSDLELVLSGPASVPPGQQLTYNLLVKNTGTKVISNVTVFNELPANVLFVSANEGGMGPGLADTTVSWSIDNLLPSDEKQLAVVVQAPTTPGETITNNKYEAVINGGAKVVGKAAVTTKVDAAAPTATATPGAGTPTATPSTRQNRVMNGDFNQGKTIWQDPLNNAQVPGGCDVEQAEVKGDGISQCVDVSVDQANDWELGVSAKVLGGDPGTMAGVAVYFYENAFCDTAQTDIYSDSISTDKTALENLTKPFTFDTQAKNAKSALVVLYATGSAASVGCFDNVTLSGIKTSGNPTPVPTATATATAQASGKKVFLPLIIKTGEGTGGGTTPTPNTNTANRVNNPNFDTGKTGWADDFNNAEVPGGCEAGQADIGGGGISQCIVINPQATQWTFGATVKLREGDPGSSAGVMLDFYSNSTCDTTGASLSNQEVRTTKMTAEKLSKSFSFDSAAQNAKSVSLMLFTQGPPAGGTSTKGCFDEVFFK